MHRTIADLFRDAERLETGGQATAALDLYKAWIAFHPDDPHLHAAMFNHAVVLARNGDKLAAITVLRDCIRLKPDFQPPYINLGRLLEDMGQAGAAVGQWLGLVNQLAPLNGEGMRHKLMALQQIGRVLENNHVDGPAEDALRQSLELDPDQPEVAQHWIALRQKQCKWPVVQGWEGVSKHRILANISPLSTAVMFDDPVLQLGRAWRYARQSIAMPTMPPSDFTSRRGARPDKLRIGYVSSDLREHAVGFGLSEVMELHDRSRHRVHAYYCGIAREDKTKARIRASVDSWVDINGLSDDDAARRISDDGIDILIDVNGYTRDARTAVFARRPAPIQVNWYGFPGTMGTPYHHYVIGDAQVIPPEHEKYFTEKVLRLPCYQPNDRRRTVAQETPVRRDENLPDHGFVFCCLNGSQKITATIFAAWMRILAGVPDSVLWLLDSAADTMARLRQMAEEQGIAAHRLCFAPKRPNPQHLARYRLADLFLDTFPYGAHTTASDAMWMGVPVVTMPGTSFAARVCAGLVQAAGLPDLICADVDGYVARAVAIGRDPDALSALRQRLELQRDSSVLFDTPRLVRHLESLYDEMWNDFAEDRQPVPDLRNLDVYEEIAIAINCTDQAFSEERYRDRLQHWNGHYPVAPDNRLWRWNDVAPMASPARRKPVRPTSKLTDGETQPRWLQKSA